MMPTETRLIGNEMAIARRSVPVRNRPKFDVEARDYYLAICEAVRTGNLPLAADLYRRWHRRVDWLAGDPDCFMAPPCLVRKEGETETAYRERCYEAGRWI